MSWELDRLSLVERATRFAVAHKNGTENKSHDELKQLAIDLHQQLAELQQELAQTKEAYGIASSQLVQANRQAADFREKFEKQLERAEKFKSAYGALKESEDFRVGRAISGPLRRIRRLANRPLGNSSSVAKATVVSEATSKNSPVPERTQFVVTHSRTETKNVLHTGIDSPNKQVISEAKRRYLRDGEVREPLLVLEENVNELSVGEKALLEQIRGLVRITSSPFEIPPRQYTPGFIPVNGRVLYAAHSTGHFNSNGYSTRTAGLNASLSKISDVVVVARPGYPWDSNTQQPVSRDRRFTRHIDGVKHVFNPGPSLKKDPIDLFVHRAADIFLREAITNRVSLIHAASNHLTALPALIAARRLGLPFVYEVRGLWEITEASTNVAWLNSERFNAAVQLETQVAMEADKVLAITRQVKDELVRRGVDPARIELLPNASDPHVFAPLQADKWLVKKHSISKEEIVVGYAGSVIAYEGLELLVRGFHHALSANNKLRLIIVGDGAGMAAIRELVSELGIQKKVLFVGRIPAEKVPDYVNLMDIVACPRLSNAVTEMVSPIKPLEAFASGKPVLASNVAPLTDLIGENQERGRLFEAGNAASLSKVLLELAENSELRADLGRSARKWVEENRSWDVVANSLKATHDSLLASAREVALAEPQETPRKRLSNVRIALISDEFTRRSIETECELVYPEPQSWRAQLEKNPVDALIIESAWEGNGGAWHRKVGFYDDESFADLVELVTWCRVNGIPTIFWNKEDPVHIQRFKKTAALVDHVFTTDENMIPVYFESSQGKTKTFSALPFWAQPALHSPLPPVGKRRETIAYGGSYYGDRYADRSRTLSSLLQTVAPFGLTIYDRQANFENSPYKYPKTLERFVEGGLSYPDMVDAYKQHPVHINVNSVVDSPTMFSRRVMELAACGTPVISGAGLGVHNIMDGLVPTTSAKATVAAVANMWMHSEKERLRDAWKLHRHVFSGHLSEHRLTLMLRTAGMSIEANVLPSYSLRISNLGSDSVNNILAQSLRPERVVVPAAELTNASAIQLLQQNGIGVVTEEFSLPEDALVIDFGGFISEPLIAEDIIRTSRYWNGPIQVLEPTNYSRRYSLWAPAMEDPNSNLDKAEAWVAEMKGQSQSGGTLQLWRPRSASAVIGQRRVAGISETESKRIVVAGHDLKFASKLIEHLESQGHEVRLDKWVDHSKHDERVSNELIGWAQSIFCEWSLGNTEWYAAKRKPGQRLITRFHSQELFTPHMQRLNSHSVDKFVFVGDFVRQVALRRFDIPEERTALIPNLLGVAAGAHMPDPSRRFTLGLVGIVPRQKHLDRALDLLSQLRKVDSRFELRVKGKQPEDYEWMLLRDEEMAYYRQQRDRIANDPSLQNAVHFDPHGDDMQEWYGKIGIVLSVSDFESFHLTLADGAMAAAVPMTLAWPGANHIYPGGYISENLREMASKIQEISNDPLRYEDLAKKAQKFAIETFNTERSLEQLTKLLVDEV